MIAGNDEQRTAERTQERRGAVVLLGPASVREVAARDDECRVDALDQAFEGALDGRHFVRPDMDVRDVENPGGHGRRRL